MRFALCEAQVDQLDRMGELLHSAASPDGLDVRSVVLVPVSITFVGLKEMLETGYLYPCDGEQWRLYAPLRTPPPRNAAGHEYYVLHAPAVDKPKAHTEASASVDVEMQVNSKKADVSQSRGFGAPTNALVQELAAMTQGERLERAEAARGDYEWFARRDLLDSVQRQHRPDAPMTVKNGHWVYFARKITEQVALPGSSAMPSSSVSGTQNWVPAFHGTWFYALWNLLATGQIAPSFDERKGHEFNKLGTHHVYCTPVFDTAFSYARAHNVFGDGVYHRCILELRVDVKRRWRQKEKGGNQWTFPSDAVVIVGVCIVHNSGNVKGWEHLRYWDAEDECVPVGCEPIVPPVARSTQWTAPMWKTHLQTSTPDDFAYVSNVPDSMGTEGALWQDQQRELAMNGSVPGTAQRAAGGKRGSVCVRSFATWQNFRNCDLLLQLRNADKRLFLDQSKDGRSEEVQEQVLASQTLRHMKENARRLILRHLTQNGGSIRVGIESHMGRHRSVAMAEELGKDCAEFADVEIWHMCVNRWDPSYPALAADSTPAPANQYVLRPESRNAE
eukprot:s119_g7.t1